MSTISDKLFSDIGLKYTKSTRHWHPVNQTYDQKIRASVMDEMVATKLGGYGVYKRFSIGTKRYKCKIFAPQNKYTRLLHSYGDHKYEGTEWYCNLLIFEDGKTGAVLNLHFMLYSKNSEARRKANADRRNAAPKGWKTT